MDECAFHFIQKTVSIHLNYPLGEIVCVVLLLFSGILLFPRSLENTDTNKTSKIKKMLEWTQEFLMDHFGHQLLNLQI